MYLSLHNLNLNNTYFNFKTFTSLKIFPVDLIMCCLFAFDR